MAKRVIIVGPRSRWPRNDSRPPFGKTLAEEWAERDRIRRIAQSVAHEQQQQVAKGKPGPKPTNDWQDFVHDEFLKRIAKTRKVPTNVSEVATWMGPLCRAKLDYEPDDRELRRFIGTLLPRKRR